MVLATEPGGKGRISVNNDYDNYALLIIVGVDIMKLSQPSKILQYKSILLYYSGREYKSSALFLHHEEAVYNKRVGPNSTCIHRF